MKVLFVDMHREGRSPSQRFRYEQYLNYLKEEGVAWEHSYLLSKNGDANFYKPGNYFQKFKILFQSIGKRYRDIQKAGAYIDIVFVQREAFMLGVTYFEKQFSKSKAKMIFDFVDAIWLLNESRSSAPNRSLSWLKNPEKTKFIIGMSDLVIAGNEYLAKYAKQFNENVVIIPTTIDTDLYLPKNVEDYDTRTICIGWSGSKTTIDHFEEAIPTLIRIKKKYGSRIMFKVIGDEGYMNAELGIKGQAWKKETETQDLSQIDIGIMPLPDDEWAKGKCGLKGLQYMALGIPTIMSPVGVNSDIIHNGRNGFLSKSSNDFVDKLSLLIESVDLRREVGVNGRKTVEQFYSVNSQKKVYLSVLRGLIE